MKKNIRLFAALIIFALLTLTLCACEIAIPEIEISGDIPSSGEGMGNNDTPDNSGTPSGDNTDTPQGGTDHVCDMQLVSESKGSCTENGERIFACTCGKVESETVPAAHTEAIEKGREATCSQEGYTDRTVCGVCGAVLVAAKRIDMLPHTEVIDPATPATETSPAKTEGKHCSVCGKVTVKQQFDFGSAYSTPENYDGDYAYNSLLLLEHGSAMAELYLRIDAEADHFHSSGIDLPQSENGIIASFDYTELGLSTDEALAVWTAYRTDHPLYYWISNTVSYTKTKLFLAASDEYCSGEVRNAKNTVIYNGVRDVLASVAASTVYHTALAFHDEIILRTEYAYESDGTTPSNAASAHNVLGVFDTGAGVCEAYAKAYQLLLNYCDIENVVVSGYAGEAHAWNLVKLENGGWYWCDLTWDDTPEFMLGISYKYFMICDFTDLSGTDGPWITTDTTFLATHTPSPVQNSGVDYNYQIPERATSEYQGSALLRETFTQDGMTYAISGYGTVQLVCAMGLREINIPQTVVYLGTEYTVASVGIINGKYFEIGSIAFDYVNKNTTFVTVSVSVPDTVRFIWDGAFDIDSLVTISVDPNSEYFTDINGVLFTKDKTTLVKYPTGRDSTEYTVPEGTVRIAGGAFSAFYYNRTLKLQSLTLAASVELVGVMNYGYGYCDISHGNFVENEIASILHYMPGGKIYTADGVLLN